MKQKFMVLGILLVMVQLASFAQTNDKFDASLPLVTEMGISEISASGNIDVILTQDAAENVRVKATNQVIKKLKVSIQDGKLSLSPAKALKEGERLAVYVWVNDLEKLSLTGSSFATSIGTLHNSNLHITADREAIVLLKSNGKLWFDTPSRYQVVKGDGYSLIQSL